MIKLVEENGVYSFELFGGKHTYNKFTKTYRIDRPYGIFSNLTVGMYGIFCIQNQGHNVKNLEFVLDEYIRDENIYNKIFSNNEEDLNLFDIPNEEIEIFDKKLYPTFYGLGHNIVDLNFKISSKIINKFFNPSSEVKEIYNNFITTKKIDLSKTVFLWARKTDKIRETKIPEVSEYIKLLRENNLLQNKIIIQTDDYSVLEEFKNENIEFEYFDEIPFSMDGSAFHGRLDMVTDEQFYERYNQTKIQYIQRMYASSLIARDSKYCVIYPGNPTTYVPMMRGSYDNTFLFKDSINYYNHYK